MKEHEDQVDRNLLTNVRVEPRNNAEKAQVYRQNQWFHMLSNFGQIIKIEKGGEIK